MAPYADDDTVRLNQRRASRSPVLVAAVAGLVGVLLGGTALWVFIPRPSPPHPAVQAPAIPVAPVPVAPAVPAPPAGTAPAIPAAPAFPIQTATEAEIRDHSAATLTVFRFAPNPDVIVMDFSTLLQQGLMLDRVAALVEKAGLPRDRVLSDAQLAAAIAAHGDTVATWYYGHDYSAADLARFFALADRDHVTLNPEEDRLRALVTQLGWFKPDPKGALITLTRVGADKNVTPDARATILRHELSHGEFFSDPDYAAYVRRFWEDDLTPEERASVRHFLGREEYDTNNEELMMNEMQAYVMFTLNPHFCTAADLGMTPERREQLREAFRKGLTVPWLRDAMAHPVMASL